MFDRKVLSESHSFVLQVACLISGGQQPSCFQL